MGGFWHHGSWRKCWVRACDRAETHARTHDLRHTAASLAIAAGADPRALREMTGHASVAVLLDIYSHLYKGRLEAIADALDTDAQRVLSAMPDQEVR